MPDNSKELRPRHIKIPQLTVTLPHDYPMTAIMTFLIIASLGIFALSLFTNSMKYQGGPLWDDQSDGTVGSYDMAAEECRDAQSISEEYLSALVMPVNDPAGDPADDCAYEERISSHERIDKLKDNLEDYGICDPDLFLTLDFCRCDPESVPSLWPVKGIITSGFGYRRDPLTFRRRIHKGVDIYVPSGTPIKAAADGVVKVAGWKTGYGRVVYLDHGNGLTSRYAHLSRFGVKRRAQIRRGDIIGKVGRSGRVTGPHLHYEVRWRGEAVNPKPFLLAER